MTAPSSAPMRALFGKHPRLDIVSRFWRVAWVTTILAVLSGSGCANVPLLGDADDHEAAQIEPTVRDPLLEFLASANDNETAAVSGTDGELMMVTAGQRYNAASGRVCRRYVLGNGGNSERGIACQLATGSWKRVQLLGDSVP